MGAWSALFTAILPGEAGRPRRWQNAPSLARAKARLAAWDFSLPIAERPVFLQHQEIFSANARPDPGDSPRNMWFLKQMFPDHMKGWQSITVGLTIPSFVKIPNIRKWAWGLKEASVYSPASSPWQLGRRQKGIPGARLGVPPFSLFLQPCG